MIETLLEVRNLSKTFRYRTGWFRRQTVEAVKPLSFTLREGQTLAIIGENGSGKSTLAKMLAGMIEPTSGELLIDDHPLHFGDYSFRSQRIRMIFQDPSTSLNPRQRISQILDFPLRLNTDLEPEQRRKQIIETMRMVGAATGSRQLLSAYVGTRAKTASGSGTRADIAPKSHYCR
ncbi:peptide ABC transporter ATP-binding protein [Escherichia coli]|uniref:Peptide ABC transporter ATP-binding protein n=1 Tax=Escherichia coli TaxID=562 RepID=A0A447XYB5_ECOLX|nr:peptide ABC transporter ATP-binding protein [Escherichia coli]